MQSSGTKILKPPAALRPTPMRSPSTISMMSTTKEYTSERYARSANVATMNGPQYQTEFLIAASSVQPPKKITSHVGQPLRKPDRDTASDCTLHDSTTAMLIEIRLRKWFRCVLPEAKNEPHRGSFAFRRNLFSSGLCTFVTNLGRAHTEASTLLLPVGFLVLTS